MRGPAVDGWKNKAWEKGRMDGERGKSEGKRECERREQKHSAQALGEMWMTWKDREMK